MFDLSIPDQYLAACAIHECGHVIYERMLGKGILVVWVCEDNAPKMTGRTESFDVYYPSREEFWMEYMAGYCAEILFGKSSLEARANAEYDWVMKDIEQSVLRGTFAVSTSCEEYYLRLEADLVSKIAAQRVAIQKVAEALVAAPSVDKVHIDPIVAAYHNAWTSERITCDRIRMLTGAQINQILKA